jgi:type I restriction enzyme S subunit
MGSTHQTIYMPDAAAFSIPVPSIDEQKGIVGHLRREKSRLERMEDLVASSVEILREYRNALVTAAVTGKIDVRGAR